MPALETEKMPALTVSQLTTAIKHCLETTFPTMTVQGEVSNCKLHSSGHLYFSLKDAGAQISAVMYRSDAVQLKSLPKEGDQVVVKGDLNVFSAGGKYQLIVKELKAIGLGELLLKLEELKIKLLKKGYFKKERKQVLPKMPRRIGVVTSPTGAAIQDIVHILTRRFSGFHLILNPVKVQGEGAAQEIAQAIHQFNRYGLADVIIVGRGGGSIEDLWAFNDEIVADAIFQSQIPIISAVGHETDNCIADFVADVRAPTPSAAAEIVIAEKAHHLKHLAQVQQRVQQTLKHLIRHYKEQLKGICRHSLLQTPYGILGTWMQRLDEMRQQLDQEMLMRIKHFQMTLESKSNLLHTLKPATQIMHFHQKLGAYDKTLQTSMANKIYQDGMALQQIRAILNNLWHMQQANRHQLFQPLQKRKQLNLLMHNSLSLSRERLKNIAAALQAIDPKHLLSKGYAIIFAEKDRSVITSVSAVERQQQIRLLLSDGEILSTIKDIFPK